MPKQFTRVQEDFICGVCGAHITGNGYTNHCPYCLTSRHVDIAPGDRASKCGGLMPAVALETKGGAYVLTQTCVKCGHTRKNKTADNDSFQAILALSKGELKDYITDLKTQSKDNK